MLGPKYSKHSGKHGYILKLIAVLILCVSYSWLLKKLLISLMKSLANAEIES